VSEKCIAIIPARAGSVRIPGKNMKPFHGKPIVQYSIEKAMESCLFEKIVVSSDSLVTVGLANQFGVDGQYRPKAFADAVTGTQAVARYVLQCNKGYDFACVIYATAPMMSIKDLKQGLELLKRDGRPYVYSVGPDWQDAGQFYWGDTMTFLRGVPLEDPMTAKMRIDASRVCDINTPEEWSRAEEMYTQGGFASEQ